jgi:hypothetical protein
MKCNAIILSIIAFFCTTPLLAQNDKPGYINPEDREVDMDNPTFVPMVKVGKVLLGGDSVQYVELNNIYVYPPLVFKDAQQQQAFNRLVYNVKKVLPIAKECNQIILETYDYLQTLPNKKAKDEHMKRVEARHQKGIYAPNEEVDLCPRQTAHQVGLPRVQLFIL